MQAKLRKSIVNKIMNTLRMIPKDKLLKILKINSKQINIFNNILRNVCRSFIKLFRQLYKKSFMHENMR